MSKKFLLCLGFLLLSNNVYSGDDSCSKKLFLIDTLLCNNPQLYQLDLDVFNLYKTEYEKSNNKEVLINLQKKWMLQVRDACEDTECLSKVLQERKELLANGTLANIANSTSKAASSVSYRFDKEKPVFEITKGQEYEICKVFVNYLNSEYYQEGDCTIKEGFDKRLHSLQYKPVDINLYAEDLIDEITKNDKTENKPFREKYIRKLFKNKEIMAWIANVDIKNNGGKDNILVTRRYTGSRAIKDHLCEGLGGGMDKLNNGKIDNNSWGGGLIGEPIMFDNRTFLLVGSWGINEDYNIIEPVSSTSKLAGNGQFQRGEVTIINICTIH